jgi:hypothetical protein
MTAFKHRIYTHALNRRKPPNFALLTLEDLQRIHFALAVELLYWQVYLLREWIRELA